MNKARFNPQAFLVTLIILFYVFWWKAATSIIKSGSPFTNLTSESEYLWWEVPSALAKSGSPFTDMTSESEYLGWEVPITLAKSGPPFPDMPSESEYLWWLQSWITNEIICTINIYHEGVPTYEEIEEDCGSENANNWITTPMCDLSKGCKGFYIHLANVQPFSISNNSLPSSSTQQQINPKDERKFVDACARIWQSRPPPAGAPWMVTPDDPADLATYEDYYYLAGRLIANGLVNVNGCPSGGLGSNGFANECGMDRAQEIVYYWQNQFDSQILDAAYEYGVPARLIKNLFAMESQFWPGTFAINDEYGFGQLTSIGADVLLMWNPKYYNEFCPIIFPSETCSKPYVRLSKVDKSILWGSIISRVDADCLDCPTGIDLEKAKSSIPIFANLLIGNCAQLGQSVTLITGYEPGSIASYEDLWRYTLVNYNVGSGYIILALDKTWNQTGTMVWQDVKDRFEKEFREDTYLYVENIIK